MRSTALILCLLAAAPAPAQDWRRDRPAPKDGHAYPECYCTNRGVRVEIGQTACLRVDGREFTALCGMSLNNPTWRPQRDGCAPDGLSRARPASPRSEPG